MRAVLSLSAEVARYYRLMKEDYVLFWSSTVTNRSLTKLKEFVHMRQGCRFPDCRLPRGKGKQWMTKPCLRWGHWPVADLRVGSCPHVIDCTTPSSSLLSVSHTFALSATLSSWSPPPQSSVGTVGVEFDDLFAFFTEKSCAILNSEARADEFAADGASSVDLV